MALKEGDNVITSYRDHVQAMVAGMSPEGVLAELYGKEGGVVKGKGGSMHMFSKEIILRRTRHRRRSDRCRHGHGFRAEI